jgi:uncharacterized repeat protein (TIGR01451 family)
MQPHGSRRSHLQGTSVLIAALVGGLLLAFTAPATSASAQAQAGPQLSIAIDDGHTSAKAGDELTYTITVRDLGSAPVTGLVVTQTRPTGLTLKTASPAAVEDARTVTWTVDLAANGAVTLHSTMTVSTTPHDLLRLASVACAATSAAGPPIVCATHSDQLPAGARAAHAAETSGARGASNRGGWILGGGAAVVVIGALGMLRARRRRAGR